MVKQAESFSFISYSADWQTGTCVFNYEITFADSSSQTCTETLIFPVPQDMNSKNETTLENLLRDLHLVLGVSYYKMYCPPIIKTPFFTLSKDQSDFWNTVYTRGLGEFFYTNGLDFRNLVNIPFDTVTPEDVETVEIENEKSLVALGGGKDSIVSIELLKKGSMEFDVFSLQLYDIQKFVADIVGKQVHVVQRMLDPKMIALGKSGEVYNGHVPISAIYAFVSLMYGYLHKYSNLVFSNEMSSNYGNVEYLGQEVNHQWSKTREFEDLFRAYVSKHTIKGISYFSLLRPYFEIKIAQLFSKHPQYFEVFSSSNHNFKEDRDNNTSRWDYNSAKTVFVFTLLSAFLSRGDMVKIFGSDLYEKEELLLIFQELLGVRNSKPFDCVGTPEETIVAMHMAHQSGEFRDSFIMRYYETEVLPHHGDIEALKEKVLAYGDDGNIPDTFKALLS